MVIFPWQMVIFPLNMVIFHSYVSLPEGIQMFSTIDWTEECFKLLRLDFNGQARGETTFNISSICSEDILPHAAETSGALQLYALHTKQVWYINIYEILHKTSNTDFVFSCIFLASPNRCYWLVFPCFSLMPPVRSLSCFLCRTVKSSCSATSSSFIHNVCKALQSHFTEIYKWAMKNTPIPSHYTGWLVSKRGSLTSALSWWVRVTMQPSMFRTMRKRAPSKSICTRCKGRRWDGKTEPNGSWSGAFNFTMPRN